MSDVESIPRMLSQLMAIKERLESCGPVKKVVNAPKARSLDKIDTLVLSSVTFNGVSEYDAGWMRRKWDLFFKEHEPHRFSIGLRGDIEEAVVLGFDVGYNESKLSGFSSSSTSHTISGTDSVYMFPIQLQGRDRSQSSLSCITDMCSETTAECRTKTFSEVRRPDVSMTSRFLSSGTTASIQPTTVQFRF